MYHLAKSLYLHYTSKEEYSILLLGLDNAGKTTLLNQVKALYNTTDMSSTASNEPSTTAGNTVPTVGQNVATINLPDMYLKFWDIGGQLTLRRLWQSYYKSAHAVVFVVDSSDIGSDTDLAKLPGFIDHARRKSSVGISSSDSVPPTPLTPHTPSAAGFPGFGIGGGNTNFGRLDECRQVLETVLHSEDMVGIPILVLANKQDREDCVEVVRIKEGFVRPLFEGERGGMVRDSRVLPVSALRGTGVNEAVEWVRSRVVWNKEGRAPVMR
jgi:ADP-ribosylation factor related protein 1